MRSTSSPWRVTGSEVRLDRPLDLDGAGAARFLSTIQGNILKRHGRRHAAHLFFHFEGPGGGARRFVSLLARRHLTSARVQREAARRYKAGEDSGTFAMLGLSHGGYLALGIPASLRPRSRSGSFSQGMKARGGMLGDPASREDWEPHFLADVHALVLVADDRPERLGAAVEEVVALGRGCARLLAVERGEQLFNDKDQGIEHFGFVDGISQPRTLRQDVENESRRCGASRWDASAPLRLLLTADYPGSGSHGTFLVFRKLEQDVRGFTQGVKALSARLGRGEPDLERAFALTVGRFRDGTPLMTVAPRPAGGPANDFDFERDHDGRICPFHAHIRKMNGRRERVDFDWKRSLRIARRGITYGARPDLTSGARPRISDLPSGGVGLLFISVQSSLGSFEKLQQWANDVNFPVSFSGVDPVIGGGRRRARQLWHGGKGRPVRAGLSHFVTLKGGEYFFAPSLRFLSALD